MAQSLSTVTSAATSPTRMSANQGQERHRRQPRVSRILQPHDVAPSRGALKASCPPERQWHFGVVDECAPGGIVVRAHDDRVAGPGVDQRDLRAKEVEIAQRAAAGRRATDRVGVGALEVRPAAAAPAFSEAARCAPDSRATRSVQTNRCLTPQRRISRAKASGGVSSIGLAGERARRRRPGRGRRSRPSRRSSGCRSAGRRRRGSSPSKWTSNGVVGVFRVGMLSMSRCGLISTRTMLPSAAAMRSMSGGSKARRSGT